MFQSHIEVFLEFPKAVDTQLIKHLLSMGKNTMVDIYTDVDRVMC